MFASGVAGASSCPSLGICGQSNPSLQRLLSQNLCSRRNFRGGFFPCEDLGSPTSWEQRVVGMGEGMVPLLEAGAVWGQTEGQFPGGSGWQLLSWRTRALCLQPPGPHAQITRKKVYFSHFFLAACGNWIHLPLFPLCYQNLSSWAERVFGHGQTSPQRPWGASSCFLSHGIMELLCLERPPGSTLGPMPTNPCPQVPHPLSL